MTHQIQIKSIFLRLTLVKIDIYTMYILASDFFEKDAKYMFKARNLCCV